MKNNWVLYLVKVMKVKKENITTTCKDLYEKAMRAYKKRDYPKAIELSELKNGDIWIEFWEERSEDYHYQDCHSSVAEITFKKYDDPPKF